MNWPRPTENPSFNQKQIFRNCFRAVFSRFAKHGFILVLTSQTREIHPDIVCYDFFPISCTFFHTFNFQKNLLFYKIIYRACNLRCGRWGFGVESFGMLCRSPVNGLEYEYYDRVSLQKHSVKNALIVETLQVVSNCGTSRFADPNLFIVYKMPKNS